MRRFFSTTPLPPAAVLLRSSLERASLLTRTPILLCDNASAQAPAFVQRHLDASPGQRCLVLTPPTSTRAAPLLHYLRRGGYFPLTVELPDTAPNAAHALAAISAARRTGVSFVVGVGSSSTLSVARAVAALLPNGGSAMDYAGNLGGTAELRQPSLPLLSVPTCPSGLELCRQSLLLVEGHALAELRSHPQSLQAALIDPTLAASLAGEAALTTAWSALAHALEAYTRADSGRAGRELAWAALELAARALLPALAAGASSPPRHKAAALPAAGAGAAAAAAAAPSPATLLAASSALVSAALAEGPLGPCRGVALSIATRYAIPYATALLAVTPKVFGEPAARTLGAYEEIAREMEASVQQQQQESGEAALAAGKEWEWEAGKGAAAAASSSSSSSSSSRRRGGGVLPSPQGFGAAAGSSGKRQRAARRSGEEGELARREAEEDQELMRLAYEAREEMGGGSEGEAGAPEPPRPLPSQYSASQEVPLGEGEEDSELIRAARRYAHVGALLKDALGAQQQGAQQQQQQQQQQLLVPWAPLAEVEGRVRLDAAGRELGGGLEGSLRALSGAGAALAKVSSGAPRLEDYGLSEADFAAIAEMAEVDANTLTALMALKKRDLVEMLQES
jgi:alcohol dehydrogenase class IV